jgi:ATP/maltotriose-dependent transcriptional regulator MalT
LEAAVASARAAGDLRTAAIALNGLGAAAYFQGDLTRSAMRTEESLALAREAGSVGDVALILSHLGDVALHQGDVARATALSEEALTLSRRAGELQAEVNTLCTLGQLARQGGDLATAFALQRQGLALARERADPRCVADTLEYLVNVVGAAGHGEQAARLLGAATALREAIGAPGPSVERAMTEQAVVEARGALGEEAWAAAFAAGRAMTLEEAIAEALGEDEGAADSAAEVTQPEPEATPLAPKHDHPNDLTPREVEVLRLVAAGLSNPQIAQQLVVSARTVEAHLRSIFSKLDVTSRTAAARFALEHGLV